MLTLAVVLQWEKANSITKEKAMGQIRRLHTSTVSKLTVQFGGMHLMNWLEHVNMKDPEYLDVIIHLNVLALITLRPQELAWKD